MKTKTKQAKFWLGTFAKPYFERNFFDTKELDKDYAIAYGVTRTQLNKEFLRSVPKNARILEVGANAGNILLSLQKLGYKDLYGIELNPDIVAIARRRASGFTIIQGDALDIPFKDGYFDLVFTSGVLIHIAPKNRRSVMSEIYRVSKKYIWGYEYFADKSTEIPYRGNRHVLWKAPFSKLYRQLFPDLKLVRERKYKYKDNNNEDIMFLLRK